MSTWVIISWVCVGILTGINIFIFVKLNQVNKQMMKMIAPNAKNMNEAMSQMQSMVGQMGGLKGLQAMRGGKRKRGRGGMPGGFPASGGSQDAQIRAAMDLLQQVQKKK